MDYKSCSKVSFSKSWVLGNMHTLYSTIVNACCKIQSNLESTTLRFSFERILNGTGLNQQSFCILENI